VGREREREREREFVCAVRRGSCVATQFHPEKSGEALRLYIMLTCIPISRGSRCLKETPENETLKLRSVALRFLGKEEEN
jgi:Glutamine amidotransferase